jgi:hypothetical protein
LANQGLPEFARSSFVASQANLSQWGRETQQFAMVPVKDKSEVGLDLIQSFRCKPRAQRKVDASE